MQVQTIPFEMGFVPKAKLSALGSRSRGGRGDGLRQGCAERLKDVEEIKIGEIRIPFGGTAAVQGLALPGVNEAERARQQSESPSPMSKVLPSPETASATPHLHTPEAQPSRP